MRRDIGIWGSAAIITFLLVGSAGIVWVALAIRGAGLLLMLVAVFGVLLAIWFAAGRPPAWGGERSNRDHHWWRGGAASPHH